MYSSTERQGVHGVALIVHEQLGWLFREQPIDDWGIDAQIEVVDERGPTGRLVAAQIKSGNSYFSEKNDGFVFRGELRHLDYWRNHSLPVILILYDPSSRTAYWESVIDAHVQRTGSAWKISVPEAKRLGKHSVDELRDLAVPNPDLTSRLQRRTKPLNDTILEYLNGLVSPGMVFDVSKDGFPVPVSYENQWGVDRGNHFGILMLSDVTAASVLASLVEVESRVRAAAQAADLDLPGRFWKLTEVRNLLDVRKEAASSDRNAYICAIRVQDLDLVRRTLQTVKRRVGSGDLSIVLALSVGANPEASEVQRLRESVWELGLPIQIFATPFPLVDGAGNQFGCSWPGTDRFALSYDDRLLAEYRFRRDAGVYASPERALLSAPMMRAWEYATGKLDPLEFLRTGSRAVFSYALQMVPDLAELGEELVIAALENTEVYWLARRVYPTPRFLNAFMRCSPRKRAILGLVSRGEWEGLATLERESVMNVRDEFSQ